MAEKHPAKRSRVDESDSGAKPSDHSLRRHPEFWLEDGNIVLVAGNTAFRVYRGLLATQSTIFADMFTSASPTDDESFEGCPMVRLTDSPQDLAHLFKFLLPASGRTVFRKSPYPFEQIFATVQLAHKYHIEDVEREALDVLKDVFPSTPSTLAQRCPSACGARRREVRHRRRQHRPAHQHPFLATLAFYDCCALGGQVIHGWTRQDGSVERLSPDDLERCIDGRDALARAGPPLARSIFTLQPSPTCTTPQSCKCVLPDLLQNVLQWRSVGSSQILGGFANPSIVDDPEEDLCDACRKMISDRDKEERRGLWMTLPVYFDVDEDVLPTWGRAEEQSE